MSTHIPGQQNAISGTTGNDKLKGTKLDDTIRGLAGDDKINARHGDDFILGGADDDRIMGGKGDDWLLGGAGDNILKGGLGADQFRISGAVDGSGTNLVKDLNFAQGDSLVLFRFAEGTFDDKDGTAESGVGNDLDITSGDGLYGEGAVIDSIADLVELVKFSSGVHAVEGKGNTLILVVDDGLRTQTIELKHLLNDFVAAGGEFLI